jgi:hypothetical protein
VVWLATGVEDLDDEHASAAARARICVRRQLARLVDEHQMPRHLRPVEWHLEEEPQHRHGRIDGRRLNAGRGQSKQADRSLKVGGRCTDQLGEILHRTDVGLGAPALGVNLGFLDLQAGKRPGLALTRRNDVGAIAALLVRDRHRVEGAAKPCRFLDGRFDLALADRTADTEARLAIQASPSPTSIGAPPRSMRLSRVPNGVVKGGPIFSIVQPCFGQTGMKCGRTSST